MLWQRHSVSQFRLSAPQKRPNGCPTQDTHLEAQAAASEESRCPFPLSPARRYLMRCSLGLSATVLLVAALGCYHATVETGLTPSNQTVEKSFASGWIAGLIPPSTVQTASKCPNGAAKIETQLSFVNQLVAWLTAYIYTPMSIKVTCAESRRASVSPTAPRIDVGANPTAEQVKDAISRAATLSLRDGVPVYIEY